MKSSSGSERQSVRAPAARSLLIGLTALGGAAAWALPPDARPAASRPAKPSASRPADSASTTSSTTRAPEKPAPAENATRSAGAPASATASAATRPRAKSPAPQVQIYVASVVELSDAIRNSAMGTVGRALAGLLTPPANESDEEFDFASLQELLKQTTQWNDTSLVLSVYRQDSEGRPCWTVRVDWPLAELRRRVEQLLAIEGAKKVLGDVTVRSIESNGECEITLPEVVLCRLVRFGGGAMVVSASDLRPAATAFEKQARAATKATRVAAAVAATASSTNESAASKPASSAAAAPPLVQCLLDLTAGSEEQTFGGFMNALTRVEYSGSLDAERHWVEQWNVRWNLLVGAGVKMALSKVHKPFELSDDAYLASAFAIEVEGFADSLADLPPGTLGSRAGSEVGLEFVPGSGFLPVPDAFYQLRISNVAKATESVRNFILKDASTRAEDDEKPAWFEEPINGRTVFWHDPSADGNSGFSLFNYRTALWFEGASSDSGSSGRLIIAQTSTTVSSAVKRWIELNQRRGGAHAVPTSRRAHWQTEVRWAQIYRLAQPWLAVWASATAGAESPPSPEELGDALRDSVIDLRMEYAGLKIEHRGPLMLAAFYLPAITATALGAGIDEESEAARERMACRHLRVLHHHARLFHKDYGRWPATVDELEGYVDFDSHPYLLRLRPQNEGVISSLAGMITLGAPKRRPGGSAAKQDESSDGPDVSLFEIDWSGDDEGWRLRIRDGEFKEWKTIYIDAAGELHRVPRPEGAAAASRPAS